MSVRAYVLIETEVGRSKEMGELLLALRENPNLGEVTILAVDTVTGPYDVIAEVEGPDLDKLGRVITEQIQNVMLVQRSLTCLAVKLG